MTTSSSGRPHLPRNPRQQPPIRPSLLASRPAPPQLVVYHHPSCFLCPLTLVPISPSCRVEFSGSYLTVVPSILTEQCHRHGFSLFPLTLVFFSPRPIAPFQNLFQSRRQMKSPLTFFYPNTFRPQSSFYYAIRSHFTLLLFCSPIRPSFILPPTFCPVCLPYFPSPYFLLYLFYPSILSLLPTCIYLSALLCSRPYLSRLLGILCFLSLDSGTSHLLLSIPYFS